MDGCMAAPSVQRDLKAFRNLINQADLSLALAPGNPSIASARESLNAAFALSKDLVKRIADLIMSGAAVLGSKGGSNTSERGPEYFARIAGMRTNRHGGKPRKEE